jgi:chitinase
VNSEHFPDAASTPASRAQFAPTAVELIKDGGFDVSDIDWGCPKNETEGINYVLLLEADRGALDTYAAQYASGHQNWLSYPASKYDNVKTGMAGL